MLHYSDLLLRLYGFSEDTFSEDTIITCFSGEKQNPILQAFGYNVQARKELPCEGLCCPTDKKTTTYCSTMMQTKEGIRIWRLRNFRDNHFVVSSFPQ